jgi:hypothetical protein
MLSSVVDNYPSYSPSPFVHVYPTAMINPYQQSSTTNTTATQPPPPPATTTTAAAAQWIPTGLSHILIDAMDIAHVCVYL